MFTPDWREKTRASLLKWAECDSRISGGAITGSASVGSLDSWSDIDLAFGIKNGSAIHDVMESFTEVMYKDFGAVHHLDIPNNQWIYRVFLLSNTLQVDLAFVSEEFFGARASTFKLAFGKTAPIAHDPTTPYGVYVGYCWLYALHARSSLKRGQLWQAEFFISGMRDFLISMYCRRFGLMEKQGRGVDKLPQENLMKLNATLIKSINFSELQRAFFETTQLCLSEIEQVDKELYTSIKKAFVELTHRQ